MTSDNSEIWINGGFFLLKPDIFDYMSEGEELVVEPFARLIKENKLMAYKHEGFWRSMDTLRDRQVLEDMIEKGDMPWRVRDNGALARTASSAMLALDLARPGTTLRSSASAPMPTISRSARAARSCPGSLPAPRSTRIGASAARRRARRRSAASAPTIFCTAQRAQTSRLGSFRDCYLPSEGAQR